MEYALNGEDRTNHLKPVARGYFMLIKPNIDANHQRFDAKSGNGKKGGAPKGSSNNPTGRRGKNLPRTNLELTENLPRTNLNEDEDVNEDVDVESARAREDTPPPKEFLDLESLGDGKPESEKMPPDQMLKWYWNQTAEKVSKVRMIPITWLVVPPIVAHRLMLRIEEYGEEKILWAIDRIEQADYWHGKVLGVEKFLDDTKFPQFLNGEYKNFPDPKRK
jgi:hypothetical protein